MANSETTGSKVSNLASKILSSTGASQIQKSLAGIALAQSGTSKTTMRRNIGCHKGRQII